MTERYPEEMESSSSRTIQLNLSKALCESQPWAIDSFPAIMERATGYSERWALLNASQDEQTGTHTWRYRIQGVPDVDLIVDHIVHELTDAVLLEEWHSVTEDCYTFGSMRRDRPEPLTKGVGEETPPRSVKETPS
jgi:hypothetical protein